VLCAVTIPPADLRSLSLCYYTVCGRMCMSCEQFTSRSLADKKTKHAQMTYTCGHMLCCNNRLNERKSAGGIVTVQSTVEDPLKMVVKKDRNM
jgi:hypothetical protein